ncbi:MAG: PBP1A family penicillin-binding protein [Acidimicrobiales bacterium]|nr:PBP1A family penicillin-binding protein [Acidimicrobiales bacterium]
MDVRRGFGTVGRGVTGLTKLVAALVIVAVLTPVVAAGTALATQLFLPLPAVIPEPEEVEAIQFSEVYDKNGGLIHTYQQFDRSIPVSPGDIPQVVKDAVIAAEDRNFYGHEGFDIRGTVRALVTDVREGELAEGGSTITQQLARNAYGAGTERTINRKVREAILASQLDRSLSKEQILHEYLSIVYFGEGAYGIGAAAQVYFQKPVNELDLSEAALLAGLIPAPSRFNPRVDPVTAELRRSSVLDAMLEEDLITQAEHDEAAPREVWMDSQGYPPLTDGEGSSPIPITLVRTPRLDETQHPYFIQYLTQYLIDELGTEDPLYRGGLKIYTTFDPDVQAKAEAAMNETLGGIGDIVTLDPETGEETTHTMQMSISAIEPPTGYVRALIGGKDFNLDQTSMATGAGTFRGRGRQPGSSFKPYVLAEAFEQGVQPTEAYSGGPLTIGDYSPKNYGGAVYGDMTLRNATESSVNTVFVRLMQDVGPDEVVDLANRLGLDIPEIDPAVDGSGLSIALGSREVTTLEQASGFGTFANRGVRVPPTPVVRVFDADGELLIDRSQPEGEQVVKQATADNVTDVLRGVLTGGTAADNGIDRPAAGKTGTTQDNKDGWFVGYTPTLSTAVWMGYDPLTPRGEGISLTGGSLPAATWERFMRAALEGVPATDFSEPAPIEEPASEELQRERRGFAPGPPDGITSTGNGGPYMQSLSPPAAPVPPATPTTTTTTTTTTTPISTSTTSTTEP